MRPPYVPWEPGCHGEGFLVREPASGRLVLALFAAEEGRGNPLRLIIHVAYRFGGGDHKALQAYVEVQPDGRFSLPLQDRAKLTKAEIAEEVIGLDPRLRWEQDRQEGA